MKTKPMNKHSLVGIQKTYELKSKYSKWIQAMLLNVEN